MVPFIADIYRVIVAIVYGKVQLFYIYFCLYGAVNCILKCRTEIYCKRPVCPYVSMCLDVVILCVCFPDVHSCTGQQGTQSADTTSATTRQARVSMKLMQKATAARTAPTAPLLTGHMTCAAPFMISGKFKMKQTIF